MMLIDGSLFLRSDSADLVRVEGELSQRPSFWTRKVRIVREYDGSTACMCRWPCGPRPMC